MFDIFYTGTKPNLFVHERPAENTIEAAELSTTKYFWFIDTKNDYSDFDFNWVPDTWEDHQVHVFPSQWSRNSSTYFANKYAVGNDIHYRTEQTVYRKEFSDNWKIPDDVVASSIDFTWHPDPTDAPYNYQFPSHYQRSSGLEYRVPGATANKYITDFKVSHCESKEYWNIPAGLDQDTIDFTWRPDSLNHPINYMFPSVDHRASGLLYEVPGAEKIMLVAPFMVSFMESKDNWIIPDDIDQETVNFTWRPSVWEPLFIYHFPTKYQRSSGVEYHVPGATQKKFSDTFEVKHTASQTGWTIPEDVDGSSIDFTWRPDPCDPAYCYHFPTKFQKASGVTFLVQETGSGVAPSRYSDAFAVRHFPVTQGWAIPENIVNPNLTWRPDPLDPPFIYKFPSEYVRESGLEYHVPGATEYKFVDDISVSFDAEALPRYYIETTIEDLIALHTNEVFWALNTEMDYDEFDFSWTPDVTQKDFIHVFGSQWQKHAATYYIDAQTASDGISEIKYNYVGDQTVTASSNLNIFFIDKSNTGSKERYEELSSRFDNISRVRFANNIFSTIKRISDKATTSKFWVITSENDYSDFNFDWHAEPWQNYMLHVFGTNEQKWSDTYLINKNIFDDHCRWCEDLKDMPDLHFVQDQKTKAINVNDIYELDFGQHDKLITTQHDKRKSTRFVDSYLSVIKRIVEHSTSEYIWVTSNICDYTNFNFDWRPEPYQATMLHVFGPGNNKFGDTFLIHVPSFKVQSAKLELLDWYETVNYCTEQIVPRLPYDMVPYTGDNLTQTILSHRFDSPYALFYPEGQDISTIDYNPSMWRLKDRAIHSFTESGSVVLAPKDTIQYLHTQCYDYPQIKRQKAHFLTEKPMDIVFISNGETQAQRNWEHLQHITKHVPNRLVHIQGVKGRAEAYKAAAAASDTDWFFSVFAKLEVDADFDWGWQTDRLQQPKHYIFYARNDTVGINYGHASIIAYNKKLTLDNEARGLDFTLDQEHEVVPIHSGVTYYDGDIITAWRTSFREAIKLHKNIVEDNFVPESSERLAKWCSSNGTLEGDWNAKGGLDGVEYYNEVNGDFGALRWEFLDSRFKKKYGGIQ
jgi:hypothetical protein